MSKKFLIRETRDGEVEIDDNWVEDAEAEGMSDEDLVTEFYEKINWLDEALEVEPQ